MFEWSQKLLRIKVTTIEFKTLCFKVMQLFSREICRIVRYISVLNEFLFLVKSLLSFLSVKVFLIIVYKGLNTLIFSIVICNSFSAVQQMLYFTNIGITHTMVGIYEKMLFPKQNIFATKLNLPYVWCLYCSKGETLYSPFGLEMNGG
jgi:hypothetical protein